MTEKQAFTSLPGSCSKRQAGGFRQLTEEHTDLDGWEAKENAEACVESQAVAVVTDILMRDEPLTPATKPHTAK